MSVMETMLDNVKAAWSWMQSLVVHHLGDGTTDLFQSSPALSGLALLALTTGFTVYYRTVVVQPTKLHIKGGSTFERLLRRELPILQEDYAPTFWCFESRLQTVLSSFIRATLPHIKYRREIVTLPDGGEVALDWLDCPDSSSEEHPTVLLLPGITGTAQSEYIKTFINLARKNCGARCVVFSNRGLGGIELKTPRTYNAANTEDLSYVIDLIKGRFPNAPLMAVGVSMGGILLGNYMVAKGEEAKKKLIAAFLVSSCFDCLKGSKSLEKWGFNMMLNRHITNCLVGLVKKFKHHFQDGSTKIKNLDSVLSSKTIKQFDSLFTVQQFGFRDVDHYYTEATIAGKLDQIKVPVLALSAADDAFQPGDSIPVGAANASENFAILVTKYGGHIGFMEGWFPTRYHFSDRLFSQFTKAVFNNGDILKTL